jgi:hypothetical protein
MFGLSLKTVEFPRHRFEPSFELVQRVLPILQLACKPRLSLVIDGSVGFLLRLFRQSMHREHELRVRDGVQHAGALRLDALQARRAVDKIFGRICQPVKRFDHVWVVFPSHSGMDRRFSRCEECPLTMSAD